MIKIVALSVLVATLSANAQNSISINRGETGADRQSKNVYYLSMYGCISDADISQGSSTFGTNNTAAIQAILSLASANNPIIVYWDGKYSVTNLRIKGNTSIIAFPGCGAILRNSANRAIFENYNIAFSGTPADSNITISGGIWNGNAAGQEFIANGTYGAVCPFRWYGVYNLKMQDFSIVRMKCYAIHAINVKKYYVENFVIDVGSTGTIFADGIHADGNCEDVVFRDGYINAHDDCVAINADDQWRNPSTLAYPYYPATAGGPVRNLLIENIVLKSELFGLRILSAGSRVDNVVVKNLTGYTSGYAVVIDNYQAKPSGITQPGGGNIGSVQLENINVDIQNTGGMPNASMININLDAEQIILKDIKRNYFTTSCPTVLIGGSGTTIKSLVVDGFDSYTEGRNAVTHILIDSARVENLSISRASVIRTATSNASPLVELKDGAIVNRMLLNSVNCVNIDNIVVNTSGKIAVLMANNINHTKGIVTFDNRTSDSIQFLIVSNYLGDIISNGPVVSKSGDAFNNTGGGDQHRTKSPFNKN